MLKPELTIYDYTRILKKRKWIILITTVFVLIFTGVFTVLQESVYRTRTSVMVGKQNKFSELFGDYYSTVNLATEAKLISSSPVLEEVVYQVHGINTPEERKTFSREKLDLYINQIRSSISVAADSNTKTMDISVSGSDPRRIALVANLVAESYREYVIHRENSETVSSQEFLLRQLQTYTVKLDEKEAEMQKFKEDNKIIDINVELSSRLHTVDSIQSQMANVLAEKKTLEERLRRLAENPEYLNESYFEHNGRGVQGSILTSLQEQQIALELKLMKQLEVYTQAHPNITQTKAEIRAIQLQIDSALGKFHGKEQLALQMSIGIQDAKLIALQQTLDVIDKVIGEMPRKQAMLARMEQQAGFIRNLVGVFNKKIEEMNIAKSEQESDAPTILDRAVVPRRAIKPLPMLNMSIGLIAGLFTGVFFAFFIETVDVSVSTVEEVENYVNLPVLGIIPYVKSEDEERKLMPSDVSDKCIMYHKPRSTCAEAFRILRTNLHFTSLGSKKMFLVTSSLPGEGKTFLAINLAITFAQLGARVLIADFNLRDPEIHSYFGMPKNPGITDILIGDMNWREAIKPLPISNLFLLCSGPIPPNPSELIISDNCTSLLSELRDNFDIIIFDSSPLIPVTDGAILSSKVDMTFLVHNSIQSSMMVLLRAKSQLASVNSTIGGVVLNQLKSTIFLDTDVPLNYYYAKKEKN